MKPLQFYQQKTDGDWNNCVACYSTTKILYDLASLQKCNPCTLCSINSPKVKKKIAEALAEYYSILFNPDYTDYFRPLTDLSLLFPTAENISITPSTNFILLPLPIPSYSKRTYHGTYLSNCPYINPSLKLDQVEVNEWIRDMDLSVDTNIAYLHADKKSSTRDGKFKQLYPHTSVQVKLSNALNPVKREARIRTYKFRDIPLRIAKKLPNYPVYSLAEFNPTSSHFNYIERHLTLLEIPSQSDIHNKNNLHYNLSDYSCTFEINQLSYQNFARFFDFKSATTSSSIVNYFLKELPSLNEFSLPQIKSGIRRLNNIIKFGKKKDNYTDHVKLIEPNSNSTSVSTFNQNIHYGKYKGADGERHEFQDIDTRDYKYKSNNDLLLTSNDNI